MERHLHSCKDTIASLILMSMNKLMFNISMKIYKCNLKEETMGMFK